MPAELDRLIVTFKHLPHLSILWQLFESYVLVINGLIKKTILGVILKLLY